MDNPQVQPEVTASPPPESPASPPTNPPGKKPYVRRKPWIPREVLDEQFKPINGAYPVPPQADVKLSPDAWEKVPVPSRVVLRAVNTLGLPKERWDKAKLMAMQELGQYMSMKFTGRVLLVTSFDSLEQIQNAYKVASEIANDQKRPAQDRLVAVGMIAKITEALAKFSDQMMTLAEKTAPARREIEKPKNLPPTFAVQVNMPGAQPPSPAPGIPAISGETTITEVDSSTPKQD